MARHEHAHEVLGLAVAVLAGDHHVVDVLVVEVADGALDERAFLVDEAGSRGAERQLAHALPEAHQVFVVALDLGLGARGAGRAQDDAHALRHLQLLGDFLQALAVGRIGDLAGDAAATAGVGHQHRIAAGERQIGGESRALVAALFLDDLDQQDLAALDDFLDLVLLARGAPALGKILDRVVAAELLDDLVLFHVVIVFVLVFALVLVGFRVAFGRAVLGRFRCLFARRGLGILCSLDVGRGFDRLDGSLFGGLAGSRVLGHHQGDGFRRFRCRRVAILAGAFGRIGGFALGIRFRILCRAGFGLGGDDGLVALRPALRGTAAAAAAAAALLFLLLLALGFGLGLEQSLTVGDRDLIVIGMDFAEGEEPVAVSAVFHEGRLERRFDPGDLREIDIARATASG